MDNTTSSNLPLRPTTTSKLAAVIRGNAPRTHQQRADEYSDNTPTNAGDTCTGVLDNEHPGVNPIDHVQVYDTDTAVAYKCIRVRGM